MEEKEMTVYKHTSPDGKVYIGITKADPDKRFNNGNGYKENELFFQDIKKYGWESFTHELLAVGLTVEEACQMEIELIREYDSTNPEKGYNMQDGGMYMSVERRLKKRLHLDGLKDRETILKQFRECMAQNYRSSADVLIRFNNMLITLCEQCYGYTVRDDLDESELRDRLRDVLGALRFIYRAMQSVIDEINMKVNDCEKRGDSDAES